MKKRKMFLVAIGLFMAFVLWTALVCFVDVRPIGANGSEVGFATLNGYFHGLTGVNMWLYAVTDWLGLVPIAAAAGFGVLGLFEWVKRRQILKVDRSILILGGFYVAVMATYAFFEFVVINYRPILIDGRLEASYPSSTTMLVLCVMPTAIMQLWGRIKNRAFKWSAASVIIVFIVFMVVGRLISGVHWISDIIGGVLISASLVTVYAWAVNVSK